MQPDLIRNFLLKLFSTIWNVHVDKKITEKPLVELTLDEILILIRDLWRLLEKRFWIRWEQWMQWWDTYGGWHWLIPVIIFLIIWMIKRRYRTPDVDALEAKGNVSALIKALQYKVSETASVVTEDEIYKDSQAVKIRCAAANALAKYERTDVVSALLKALADPDKYVRINVVRALGTIGTETALKALKIVSEKDPDEFVRYVADDFLEGQGW